MRTLKTFIFNAVFTVVFSPFVHANVFLTLAEPSTARSVALGEAYSAAVNDVGAFHYNPATLSTLESNQLSLLYQNEFEQEKYGYFSYGAAEKSFSYGTSVAYFNTGDITLFDGSDVQTVTGQEDVVFSVGAAQQIKNFSFGLKPKWISINLSETSRIRTLALDAGVLYALTSRLRFGLSGSNTLTQTQDKDLSPTYRFGSSYIYPRIGSFFAELSREKSSHVNMAIGIEALVGPLALRSGFKAEESSNIISFGTGLSLNQIQLHYATNFISNKELQHLFSVSYTFGRSHPKFQIQSKNNEEVTK